MNTLTIHHQDGNREFKLTNGGYDLDCRQITISVETEPEDDEFPSCALFCLVNYLIGASGLKLGAEFKFKDDHSDGWDDTKTRANAYFQFHAERVDLSFKILAIDSDMITCELSAVTDDIDYYDGRAKANPITGLFRLPKKSKSELWIPS